MGLFRGIAARKDATRGTSPIEVRKVLAGLFASVGGIGARSGILYNGSTAALVRGTSIWGYNVDLFHAYVSRSASDGGTVYGNDTLLTIGTTGPGSTIPIAPGAGLQRIDVIWTRHPTAGENGDEATTVALASEPLFGVASGDAVSSGPVAPTIPAGAFELGRNLMTSAATNTNSAGNTITQSALFTALRGAPVPCRNQAERDAYPSPYDGLQGYRLDLHCVETYNGTAWPPLADTGWLTPGLVPGWTVASGDTPQYRRLNGIVYMRGRGASTGASASMFTLNAGFRPVGTNVLLAENSGAAVRSQVAATGAVGQVVAAAATGLSLASFPPFPADA